MPCVQNNEEVIFEKTNRPNSTELRAKDVEELVKEIKEKLWVKSSRHSFNKMNRSAPYSFNDRTDYFNGKMMRRKASKSPSSPHDHYRLVQQLLKEGTLIKEAVKRLQTRNKLSKNFDDISNVNEHQHAKPKVDNSRISSIGSFSPLTVESSS